MSDLGEIHPATGSHQEDTMATDQPSTSPRADNSQGPTDGSSTLRFELGVSLPGIEDGTNSGEATPTQPGSPAGSDTSQATIRPLPLVEKWSACVILELTTVARRALTIARPQAFSSTNIGRVIQLMLADEDSLHPISLPLIAASRLDKLLDALTRLPQKDLAGDPELAVACTAARLLEFKLQQRFKAAYFALDEARLRDLKENGAFHDIVPRGRDRVFPNIWSIARKTPISYYDLKQGMWWLNTACLMRDGITRSTKELVTRRDGVFILPLLTGTEVPTSQPGTYMHKNEGPLRELYVPLLLPAGRKVKVFRGHTLHSELAPKAGIRYDGEYVVKGYTLQLREGHNGIFTSKLLLERVRGQKSLEDQEDQDPIPGPSQLDDWELYKKVMKDEIITREGAFRYYQWEQGEVRNEKEKTDRLKDH